MSLQNRASISEEDLLRPPNATPCPEAVKTAVSDTHELVEWPPESDAFSFESLGKVTAATTLTCAACRGSHPISRVTLGYFGWVCAQCVVECLELTSDNSLPNCDRNTHTALASETREVTTDDGARDGS